MLPIKKSLKLSRNHGQKLEKASAALDDSMDDFIVTRPLRAERKAAKNKPVSKLVFDQQEADKNNQDLSSPNGCSNIPRNSGNTSSKTTDESASLNSKTLSNSEQNETHRAEYALPSVSQETFRNLQNKEISQSSSPKRSFDQNKKTIEKRRTTRRRAVDPGDLSLALALSESLQSANESARKQEEELLLTENLAEVISDLRNEEQTTGVLSHVFQKPVDAPISKVKRKTRVTSKIKEPTQYTLALRSQAERERLIADRAASILNQEPGDPLRPPKKCFNHSQPVSEYIKQYVKSEMPLWQRASLSDITSLDESDAFYVGALRSVLSPPKKKKDGYTNILLRVSQLPGRNSSQVDTSGISNTQQLLEELAFAADGGFVEDPEIQDEHPAVSNSVIASVNRLTQDWSNFLDNPNMSDVIIRTKDKNIWAHRLVFAARFPKILDSVKDATAASEKSNLDWSSFSAASVMKVLRFIYTASYEHDNEDARQVYRLARRHQMSELIELLPRQCERDSESSGESEDDSTLELDLTKRINPKASGKKLLQSPEMVIIKEKIGTQEKRKLEFNSQEKNSSPSIKSTKLFHDDQEECSVIEHLDETRETKRHDGSCVTRKVEEISLQSSTLENCRPKSCASDMDICSSNNTPNNRLAPLSPDMFQETLVESDEEENSSENLIDLTQENSDKQSDRIHSPYSCEMENSFQEKSDEDVFMLECSISPLKSLPKSSENTLPNQPVATCSRVDPSFVNDSVSSWDCYQGGIDDLHNCPSPPVNITIPSAILDLTEIDHDPPAKRCNPDHVEDEFPDELDSIFPQNTEGFEPSPIRPIAPTLSKPSGSSQVTDNNTPEPPRQAKKRKIDVTPLPDYQSMETPLLKQELVKYGLKPFKRSNAVKLLQHIYEELHPLVTDSESSFQDTPERPRGTADRHNKQPTASTKSPTKSSRDTSSYEESESGHSQEDEESLIVMELDREVGSTQSSSPGRSLPLKDRMKSFLQKRPDIYKSVLTYEPISFEYLFKEVRKERIRCKAQELLDWLDEECITCRMKNRNRPTTNRATETGDPNITPPEKVVSTSPNKKQPKARRVAKKLIT